MTMSNQPKKHFIDGTRYPLAKDAQLTPPVPCDFAVGDVVTFTNDYGAKFHNRLVTGFSPAPEYGRFVYLDKDAWWFPVRPQSLTKQAHATEVSNGSDSPELTAKERSIAQHKWNSARASERGLEVRPSINGPYLFNPSTDQVVGRKGSEEFRRALSDL